MYENKPDCHDDGLANTCSSPPPTFSEHGDSVIKAPFHMWNHSCKGNLRQTRCKSQRICIMLVGTRRQMHRKGGLSEIESFTKDPLTFDTYVQLVIITINQI